MTVEKGLAAGAAVVALMMTWWIVALPPERATPPATMDPGAPTCAAVVAEPSVSTRPEASTRSTVGAATPDARSRRAAVLTVEVRWEDDGAPVAGCPVLLTSRVRPAGQMVCTDAAGTVTFDDLEPGEHAMELLHGNIRRRVATAPGDSIREAVAIPRGHRLAGIMVDPAGLPVAGAQIVAVQGAVDPQWVFPIGVTDGSGRFAVPSRAWATSTASGPAANGSARPTSCSACS